MAATVLTKEVQEGYDAVPGAPTPYYYSSDCWLAYAVGAELRARGMFRPVKATKSVGYSVRVDLPGGAKGSAKWIGDHPTTKAPTLLLHGFF